MTVDEENLLDKNSSVYEYNFTTCQRRIFRLIFQFCWNFREPTWGSPTTLRSFALCYLIVKRETWHSQRCKASDTRHVPIFRHDSQSRRHYGRLNGHCCVYSKKSRFRPKYVVWELLATCSNCSIVVCDLVSSRNRSPRRVFMFLLSLESYIQPNFFRKNLKTFIQQQSH